MDSIHQVVQSAQPHLGSGAVDAATDGALLKLIAVARPWIHATRNIQGVCHVELHFAGNFAPLRARDLHFSFSLRGAPPAMGINYPVRSGQFASSPHVLDLGFMANDVTVTLEVRERGTTHEEFIAAMGRPPLFAIHEQPVIPDWL